MIDSEHSQIAHGHGVIRVVLPSQFPSARCRCEGADFQCNVDQGFTARISHDWSHQAVFQGNCNPDVHFLELANTGVSPIRVPGGVRLGERLVPPKQPL